MIKAFLSHSSSDKDNYVRIVAEKIGYEHCVYDEWTFEAGMKPFEEIVRGMNSSQLFVLFLSDAALNSEWVRKEILIAHDKMKSSELLKVFPIIIDSNINFKDKRIPTWMSEEYNLKYVSRPTVAARRIKQRLRELSWIKNPNERDRDSTFVGRNELVKQIEERIDTFDLELPVSLIASGLPRIGRFSLLRHTLSKVNIVSQSYEFPSIIMKREDSLEDLILKLYDLGFSEMPYPINLMEMDIDKRISMAITLVNELQKAKEIILIRDDGCLINNDGVIKTWFDNVLRVTSTSNTTSLILASKYRPWGESLHQKQYIYCVSVPDLNYTERRGLFKRLLELHDIKLTKDDFDFFSGLFHGFPDQIKYACELIRDHGTDKAKKQSHLLTEYNSEKATIILNRYENNTKALELLFLLSEFEFISLNVLFDIVSEDAYSSLLQEFISLCICDYIGIEKEYVRLNDAIRDYVRRTQRELPEELKKKLNEHVKQFIKSNDEEDRDVSDVIYSVKEAIKADLEIPREYLIPTHFIRSIRELYEERGYLDRVISLANMLLEKEHLLDDTVSQDIRYYLCLSLARKHDNKMLHEVQKIKGPERNFLLGFYYRLQGRADDAIKKYKECIGNPKVANRAKHELVRCYLAIEDYDSASVLAKANYEGNKRNPFHIQAYFNTIINSSSAHENITKLTELISELESIGSDNANQMADIAKAEYAAKCNGDYESAFDIIDDAISKYFKSPYPLIVKGNLSARNMDRTRLQSTIVALTKMAEKSTFSDLAIIKLKAFLQAIDGNLDAALNIVDTQMRRIPEYSRQKLQSQLREIYLQITQR